MSIFVALIVQRVDSFIKKIYLLPASKISLLFWDQLYGAQKISTTSIGQGMNCVVLWKP